MAASSEKKDTMMRRNDLRGAQLCTGAVCVTSSRMVWRLSGRKMSVFCRLVKRSVLEGGVGWTSGGRLERSSDREALDLRDEPVELREGGEGRNSEGDSVIVAVGGIEIRSGADERWLVVSDQR